MTGSLFEVDGEHFVPTELSVGPWSPDALHGGPVAALLARELESLDAPVPMRLVRLTAEFLRPVPLVPLWLLSQVMRDGAKVGMVEASLGRADNGQVLAVARGQRMRVADVDFDDGVTDVVPDLPSERADVGSMTLAHASHVSYHSQAVEHRFTSGMFGSVGPAFDWIRLEVPVVPGEDPTPWQRAAAAADFGNGLSSVVPFDGAAQFINSDLTVHLWREPVGEWVGLDVETRTSSTGIGTSDAALWDRGGRIGRSAQSLLLTRG